MKTEKYYKIVRIHENPYIAARRGENIETFLYVMLTKKKAYDKLLEIYNELFSDERPYAFTWSQAVSNSRKFIDGAEKTFCDGTRQVRCDSRIYSIEEMTKDEIDDVLPF